MSRASRPWTHEHRLARGARLTQIYWVGCVDCAGRIEPAAAVHHLQHAARRASLHMVPYSSAEAITVVPWHVDVCVILEEEDVLRQSLILVDDVAQL